MQAMQPYMGPFLGGAAPMLVGSPTAALAPKPAPAYSRQPQGTSVERVNVSCNGVKAVFMVHTQTIVCRCPTCTENGQMSRTMSPTEFERHSGMQSSKKWRRSIKVDMGRDSVSLGRWLEQNGYKSSTPAGMTPPVVGPSDNNNNNNNSNNNNSQSQPLSQPLSPSIMLMPQPMMDAATLALQQQMAAGGLYAPLLNPMGSMSPLGVSAAANAVKPKRKKPSTGMGQNGSGAAASSVGNAVTGGAQDEEDLLAADALNLLRHRDSSSEDNHEAGSAGPEHGEEAQPEASTPSKTGAAANGVDQASPASARLSADHYKPSSSKDTPRADAQSMSPLMKHRLANTTAVQMLKAAAHTAPSNAVKAGKGVPASNGKASARAASSGPGSQTQSEEQASHTDGVETGGEQEAAANGRASRRRQQQQKPQQQQQQKAGEREGQGEGPGEGGITGNLLSNHHHRPSNSHRIGQKHVAVQNQLLAAQAVAVAQAGMWPVPNAGFMAPVPGVGMLPSAAGSDAAGVWDNTHGHNRKHKSGSSSGKNRSSKRANVEVDDVDVDDDDAAGEDRAAAMYDAAGASQQQDAKQEQPGSGRGDTDGVPRKKKKKARSMAMPMGMAMMGPGFPGMRPFMMHPYMMGPMMAGHPAMLAQQQQQQMMAAAQQQPGSATHAMMMPPGMMWGPWGAYPAYGHGMLPSQPSPMVGMMPSGFNPFSQRESGDGAHTELVVSRAGRPHVAKRDDSHEWGEDEGEGEVDEEEQGEEEEEEEDEVGNSRRRHQGALEWDVDSVKEEAVEQDRPVRKIRKHMTTALLKHALQPLISGAVEAVGNSTHELAVTAYCPYAEFKGTVTEIGAK